MKTIVITKNSFKHVEAIYSEISKFDVYFFDLESTDFTVQNILKYNRPVEIIPVTIGINFKLIKEYILDRLCSSDACFIFPGDQVKYIKSTTDYQIVPSYQIINSLEDALLNEVPNHQICKMLYYQGNPAAEEYDQIGFLTNQVSHVTDSLLIDLIDLAIYRGNYELISTYLKQLQDQSLGLKYQIYIPPKIQHSLTLNKGAKLEVDLSSLPVGNYTLLSSYAYSSDNYCTYVEEKIGYINKPGIKLKNCASTTKVRPTHQTPTTSPVDLAFVVSTYNQWHTIHKLKSLNFPVIIVDRGSRDFTIQQAIKLGFEAYFSYEDPIEFIQKKKPGNYVLYDFTEGQSDQVDYPEFEGYKFYPNLDIFGHDLQSYQLSISELKELADQNPKCVGFNTWGHLKDYFNKDELIYLGNRRNPIDGFYLKL